VAEAGTAKNVAFAAHGNHLYFVDGGRTWEAEDVTFAPPEAAAGAAGAVRAPMAGRIVSVRVKEGASAAKGTIVVTLEAMKMEHELVAAADATVEAVHVAEGDQVAAKQVLVTFAAAE
jgi:acetyl/propionyl-CoA carboxylase alpha subunit